MLAKPKRPYLSLEKEKENFCEIRTFHVAVVQKRLRNAPRSVMQVKVVFFAIAFAVRRRRCKNFLQSIFR